jgi:hypothetical protein
MTFKYRFAIAACARWETRYAAEWLTYHRAIGFEHVYLYCNDDDPRALYAAVLPFTMGPAPFVTFRFFPKQGEHRQMMRHFLDHDRHQSEWISFLDLDEFIRLPRGQTIAQFIAPFQPVADCVMFNWVFFGPNEHKTPPAGNVLLSYTRREALLHPFTKYVARSFVFDDPKLFLNALDNSFVHRLSEYLETDIRAVNVLGEDMTHYYSDFPSAAAGFIRHPPRQEEIFAKAVIHHYAFRSEQAFTDRVARGLKGDFAAEKMWGDLAESENFRSFINEVNAVEDRRLADFWDDLIDNAQQTNVLPDPRGDLLSRGKPIMKAAVNTGANHRAMPAFAGAPVNLQTDGTGTMEPGVEASPWWQVDLGGFATIREIHLHHTPHQAGDRLGDFSLAVSIDGLAWVELIRNADDAAVPVQPGLPFIWSGPGMAWARFVRVTVLGRLYLPVDRIEVFGRLN